MFAGLPAPDAIFVGGNGGEVARLLEAAYAALRPGGRLVTNVGTLEMLSADLRGAEAPRAAASRCCSSTCRAASSSWNRCGSRPLNPTVLLRVEKT